MSSFSDYFSQTAARYVTYRPSYPPSLFQWLAHHAPSRQRAWDCGTGSGQAAVGLAEHFDEVIATDPSHAQLVHAHRVGRVRYAAMTAEQSGLKKASVQIITVAQALHWFELAGFYAEVERVLAPGGMLAVWTYGLISVDPAIDARVNFFYKEDLAGFWPAERALVETGYGTLFFPFRELEAPRFRMEAEWTLEQLAGYLETWSAVTRYRRAKGKSPVSEFIDSIRPHWGSPQEVKRVSWPLDLRAGTI